MTTFFSALKNKTTLFNLITLVILLFGLVVGLILIRYPQVFKPKALAKQVEFFGFNTTLIALPGRVGFTKVDGVAKIGVRLTSPFGPPQASSSGLQQ